MRKVVGYLLMTLDGVVEEPGDWLEHFDEDMRENMVEVINAQDAVLLGRVMYQEWAAYWPTASDELPFASFINNVPKYVVSASLSSVDEWQPATLIRGDVSQEIAKLKQQPGKNIGAHGSITLVRSLLEQGLLDELMLIVSPVLAGGGRRLLTEGDSLKRLKLVSARSTRTGALILTYQPVQH
ncbi:MAG TPA: dihydrofolate reductase family protein [Ktedonosporobacter sp.]|nr:dihydrofolate reductase family protein [Ktedonosporobacter sp.]